ncbi:hypothetical protein ACWDXV_32485 [Nocardia nova]
MSIELAGVVISVRCSARVAERLAISEELTKIMPTAKLSQPALVGWQAGDADVAVVSDEFGAWSVSVTLGYENDVASLVYCYLSPLLSAAVTRSGSFIVDAGAFALKDGGGVLLIGTGKSSTVAEAGRQGYALVSEDSCLITSTGDIVGSRSPIFVGGTGRRDERNAIYTYANWLSECPLNAIVRIFPSENPPSVWNATPVDRGSWASQLLSARPLCFGVIDPLSARSLVPICVPIVDWVKLDGYVHKLRHHTSIFGAAGRIDGRLESIVEAVSSR